MTSNKKKGFSRAVAFTCVTVMASGLVLGGCSGKGGAEGEAGAEQQKDNSILVETALPKVESIELDGNFMGTVEAENEVTVIAKVGGDVTAAYFEEGERVSAGDLLFTIDDRSAQISMAQAQASLESASATVSSASAGAAAAELNLLYTQEQIKENLGTAETSRMQLENAVATAKYALKAAQESMEYAKENFGLTQENYDDLLDQIDDLDDEADEAAELASEYKDYKRSLEQYQKNYNRIAGTDSADLQTVCISYGISYTPGMTPDEAAAIYLRDNTEASSESELITMIDAANLLISDYKGTRETARLTRAQLKDNKPSAKLALFQTAISVEQAKDQVKSAEDAKRLAEKMLEDFNLYTMATLWAGANADLAGTNSKVISAQASVIQAQAGVKSAQAGVEAAQLQLEYTQVTAPVSGVITKKNVTVNNMAPQGSEAYVIAADEGCNVVFYVAESVMRELSIGQDVTVERNGSTYHAVITENAGVADTDSGLFEVKAQLAEGADSLIAGTSVKLTLATQSADNVLTIPVDSVYYENQKAFVYCMEDGKAVKTQIETGITNNESVEVKSGLSEDSQIIVTWASQLKDGSEVKTKDGAGAQSKDADSQQDGAAVQSSEDAVETASLDGANLSDTAKLNLSIENRIMQVNEVQ